MNSGVGPPCALPGAVYPESASSAGRLRALSPILDFTGPGRNTDTPIGRPTMSVRSASVRPTTANFEVAYRPTEPNAAIPPIEDTLTMWPGRPDANIRGRKVITPLITPPTLTPIIQSQSA